MELWSLGDLNKKERDLFKKDVIKLHNTFRQRHGAKKLKWNKDVAKDAQDRCSELAAPGGEQSENNQYGENLFWSSGKSPSLVGKLAIRSWYSEVRDYDYGNPRFTAATGHFTQVRKLCF